MELLTYSESLFKIDETHAHSLLLQSMNLKHLHVLVQVFFFDDVIQQLCWHNHEILIWLVEYDLLFDPYLSQIGLKL